MVEIQRLKEVIVKEVVYSLISELNKEVMPRIEALEKRVDRLESLVKTVTSDAIKTIILASLEYHEKSAIPQIVREAFAKTDIASQVTSIVRSGMEKINTKLTEIDGKMTSLSSRISEVVEGLKSVQQSLEENINRIVETINATNNALKDTADRLSKVVVMLQGLMNEIEGVRKEIEKLAKRKW